MARYSLHAIGADRPGIVAAVTEVLAGAGCNLEDSRMSIMHGQFAIMLIVEAPDRVRASDLEVAFASLEQSLDLSVVVRPVLPGDGVVEFRETVAISVHGADRPGIVSRIARAIADLGGNIIDVSTHRIEEANGAAYVLLLSVATTPTCTEASLRDTLAPVAAALGVTCVVHAAGTELL